ncbi:MAG: hypothetical protein Kow0056_06310 [Coriobacteriia bacterium]
MSRMVRKQIVIDAERNRTLERLSDELGVSQSEVIRMAIDSLEEETARRSVRQKAWESFLVRARNAADHGVVDERGRLKWTRADLYERDDPR